MLLAVYSRRFFLMEAHGFPNTCVVRQKLRPSSEILLGFGFIGRHVTTIPMLLLLRYEALLDKGITVMRLTASE